MASSFLSHCQARPMTHRRDCLNDTTDGITVFLNQSYWKHWFLLRARIDNGNLWLKADSFSLISVTVRLSILSICASKVTIWLATSASFSSTQAQQLQQTATRVGYGQKNALQGLCRRRQGSYFALPPTSLCTWPGRGLVILRSPFSFHPHQYTHNLQPLLMIQICDVWGDWIWSVRAWTDNNLNLVLSIFAAGSTTAFTHLTAWLQHW